MSKHETAAPETLPTWYELKPQRLMNESLHPLCFTKETLNFGRHRSIEFGIHAPAQGGSRQGRTVTACVRAIPDRGDSPSQQRVSEHSSLVSAARHTGANAHPATKFLDHSEPIEAARMLAPVTVSSPPARLPLPEGYTSHHAYHDTSAISTAVQKLRDSKADAYLQVCIVSMSDKAVPKRKTDASVGDDSAISPTELQHTYAVGVTVCVRTTTADLDPGTTADQVLSAFTIQDNKPSLVSLPMTPETAAKRVQEPRFKPYGTGLLNLFQVVHPKLTEKIGPRLPATSRVRGVPGKVQVCEADLEWLLGGAPPTGDGHLR